MNTDIDDIDKTYQTMTAMTIEEETAARDTPGEADLDTSPRQRVEK